MGPPQFLSIIIGALLFVGSFLVGSDKGAAAGFACATLGAVLMIGGQIAAYAERITDAVEKLARDNPEPPRSPEPKPARARELVH